MKVSACLWFESPGATQVMQDFRSIHAVRLEFVDMVDLHRRFDHPVPTGYIYDRDNHDCPTHTVKMGKDYGVVIKRIMP